MNCEISLNIAFGWITLLTYERLISIQSLVSREFQYADFFGFRPFARRMKIFFKYKAHNVRNTDSACNRNSSFHMHAWVPTSQQNNIMKKKRITTHSILIAKLYLIRLCFRSRHRSAMQFNNAHSTPHSTMIVSITSVNTSIHRFSSIRNANQTKNLH